MPRTNPNDLSPNPCKRWFLWDGAKGDLKYYDKEEQRDIHVALPFEFILLDRLATVRGWHDLSESGIYSNEVRRTAEEPFTVRAFKMKEPIAQGLYADVKDRVKANGGKFNSNLYMAYTDDGGELGIGSVMLHGAPLRAWMEFEKENRKELFKAAIKIEGFTEGKKGGVTFRVPDFVLVEVPPEVDDKAGELQKELQKFLTKYLGRISKSTDDISTEATPDPEEIAAENETEEDSIPF